MGNGKVARQDEPLMVVEVEQCASTPQQLRNLTMVYLLFLAEAIMASSLSAQIAVLVPTKTACMSMDTSFLRSIFECAYFAGSTTGVAWGWMSDRFGRRQIALFGLAGMAVCCVCMGFANNFMAFSALRFMAGVISSAVSVSGMAMLADMTHGSTKRAQIVARLPMIAVGGSLGPLAANTIRRLSERQGLSIFAKYPGLSGQFACASLVSMIALSEALLLEEVSFISGHLDINADPIL
jgi:MFS family permease